jgi:hypothetical protein
MALPADEAGFLLQASGQNDLQQQQSKHHE